MTYEQTHVYAREKGVSRPLYAAIRMIVVPFMRIYFRLRITGSEHIPRAGAAIIAPNHKSFFDSFFICAASRRHMRFMAKSELLEGSKGWLLLRLGAFPVRRGGADEEALETAREILRQGGLLQLFPEGTRIPNPTELGKPHRGAARLALETGATIIPTAITGSDRLFFGPFPKPKQVRVSFGAPITITGPQATIEAAAQLTDELWPEIEREFHLLRSRKGVIAMTAAGIVTLAAGALTISKRRHGS